MEELKQPPQPISMNMVEIRQGRSFQNREKLHRSRVPELIVAAELLIVISIFFSTVFAALYVADLIGWSWWVISSPILLSLSIASLLFLLTICAPLPYIGQLSRLRSLQTGGNPSAVELIPMVLGNILKAFGIWTFLAFICELCEYLEGDGTIAGFAVPIFILEFFGLVYCILIVDYAIQVLIGDVCAIAFTILVLVQMTSDLSLWVAFIPVFILTFYLSLWLMTVAYNESVNWGKFGKVKWASFFLSMIGFMVFSFLICAYESGTDVAVWYIFSPLICGEFVGIIGCIMEAIMYLDNPRLNPSSVETFSFALSKASLLPNRV